MKLIPKIIIIVVLISAGPLYLFLSPKLTKAPQAIQKVQQELKHFPEDAFKGVPMLSAPLPQASTVDSILKYSKEMITVASSGIGLVMGMRELNKAKKRRRTTTKRG